MENKKAILLLIVILCSILLGVSTAYAALIMTVKVTVNNTPLSNQIWDVGFEPETVIPTKYGTPGVVCGIATVTKDSVSITDSKLITLHDKCTYKLKIRNLGDMGASISTISPKSPESRPCIGSGAEIVCGNIRYKLATDASGTTLLNNNITLSPYDGELDVYFIAEYTENTLGESLNQTTTGFAVTYIQE